MSTVNEYIARYNELIREGIGVSASMASERACRPDCEICGGVGFVRYDVPLDHFMFGKIEPCPNAINSQFAVPGRFGLRYDEQRELTWKSLDNYNNSVDIASRIAQELNDHTGAWIFLHGTWGVAKSLILKIAVAEGLRSGRHSHYVSMVDILDDLRMAFDEEDQASVLNERITRWSTIPFLAIDEFEKTNPTPWVMERMFQIFDRRYNLAVHEQAATLIASNQRPSDFRPEFESRIMDGRGLVLELRGQDIRPAMTREDKF